MFAYNRVIRCFFSVTLIGFVCGSLLSCTGVQVQESTRMSKQRNQQSDDTQVQTSAVQASHSVNKPVVYQVFTRLFGNTNTTNKPWGTMAENGVGKFSDFTPKALSSIKALGVTHIWYTGVLHHALVTEYSEYGIRADDPDVVKGRAGSPYAVKDYYNVNPDLALNPAQRLEEFESLIERTHDAGMKVVIDIVPNHVARNYHSLSAPEGVTDFGANDDTSVTYARNNNFYYVVGQAFEPPVITDSPLMNDGKFSEFPAKWTGNGARSAQPDVTDWYETVKINYGVKPDGSYDFPTLPPGYEEKSIEQHAAFWADKSLPDSWYKFRDIAFYWLDKGVDGFRYDMAEMVPVEFWSFLNSSVKQAYPDAFLLAEVYQPHQYRQYLRLGKMDYLYDKVGFYDTLKLLMQGKGTASQLLAVHQEVSDISSHMLHFLENHDEQRIASNEFAGSAQKGKPALVVSALICNAPMLLYFGQDVGEDGSEDMGFGDPSRTTIFDYAGVPAHQRFMNGGKFDGGQSTKEEILLRTFYEKVMHIATTHEAMRGEFTSLHKENLHFNNHSDHYSEQQFSFIRQADDSLLLVVVNFSDEPVYPVTIHIPWHVLNTANTAYIRQHKVLKDLLTNEDIGLVLTNTGVELSFALDGLASHIFSIGEPSF